MITHSVSLSKSTFQVEIRVYEMLGSEVLLYFDIDEANFTAKVNPRTTARPGDTVKLAMDLDKVHIFGLAARNASSSCRSSGRIPRVTTLPT